MDKTHTPGPWKGEDSVANGFLDHLVVSEKKGDPPNHWIPDVMCCLSGGGDKLANARLIAAAPELLEALEAVVNAYNEPDKVSMIDSIGKAGDLIAKVNGQGDREKTINASQQRT